MTTEAKTIHVWPRHLVAAAGTYASIVGLVSLVGWATDVQRLTDWRNDGISMLPNAAVCASASGIALLLDLSGRRRAVRALAILVASVGGLTLFEHVSSIDLGIDRMLFADRSWGQGAVAAPMRMGPPASLAFLLIGSALALSGLGPRARRASTALGLTVAAIATLSLAGHLYGAEQMYTLPRLTGIALQTASAILMLGVGLMASVPERDPMRAILEQSAAGMLARHALPIVILIPIALGWIRVVIQQHDLVDTAFGTALRTLVEVALLTGLLWRAVVMIRLHERALRESESELRRKAGQLATFFDTAAVGLSRIGPDGIVLWANDAELKTLGHFREEYVGRHVAEFHADADAIADVLARLRDGKSLVDYEARRKARDGSIRWILIDATPVWDGGRFVHSQWFTRDITERKRDEQSRDLLADIIATSDDAIVSKTLDGIITSWNAGAERMFGYTEAEALGQPIDLIVPSDRRDEEREILKRLCAGERIAHYETVRRSKDGRALDVSLTISTVKDASGEIVGAAKIARDVTDRRRLELEREEAGRRKDEFLAILAHELRNPLTPVRNAAQYLKVKGSEIPGLGRPIEMIERQVAQMSRLIDDLLDVSRISRGALAVRRALVSCSEIVEAAVDACRDDLQAKGHSLRTSVPAKPIMLLADRERLLQVLCNLLGNAAKYTPAGGRIELTVATAGDVLEVSVKDDGIGIPRGKLTEIFELFARVDPSLERQGGVGIGLTLVRQLVELHGGTIEARSEGIGRGSEFVLTLPIVVSAAASVPESDEATQACAPRRILVADDNPDAVESLKLLLELGGHDVHTAFDGEAAIRCAEKLMPEVALLDIGMPKANGYEVARRIREYPWGKGIYLVALTGWGQEDDKRRAREAGFDAHLVKPVPPDAIDRILATMSNPLAGP